MSSLWIMPDELSVDALDDNMAKEASRLASFILWAYSGRRYSAVRTVTETYECPCTSETSSRFEVVPSLLSGAVINEPKDGCGCQGLSSGRHTRLRLHGRPVRRVQEVRKGSETLDPSSYSVQNSGLLTIHSGNFDVCGIEVTYTYGTGIPTGGRLAAKLLAEEFAKSWIGDSECRLPDRVTNVSRQGVSFSIIDKQEFLDELRTGILEIDMFLRAINPDRARKKAKVFSPDIPRSYRTTANFKASDIRFHVPENQYDFALVRGQEVQMDFRLYGTDGAPAELTSVPIQGYLSSGPTEAATQVLDLGPHLLVNGIDPTVLELRIDGATTAAFPLGDLYWSVYLDGKQWLYGQVLVGEAPGV